MVVNNVLTHNFRVVSYPMTVTNAWGAFVFDTPATKVPGCSADFCRCQRAPGKKTAAHKDVKFWHYFKGKVETVKGTYDITINIRDKGDKQFVYEIGCEY